jgi:hypothetical protein
MLYQIINILNLFIDSTVSYIFVEFINNNKKNLNYGKKISFEFLNSHFKNVALGRWITNELLNFFELGMVSVLAQLKHDRL